MARYGRAAFRTNHGRTLDVPNEMDAFTEGSRWTLIGAPNRRDYDDETLALGAIYVVRGSGLETEVGSARATLDSFLAEWWLEPYASTPSEKFWFDVKSQSYD